MEASPTKKGYRRLQAVYMFYQGCDHEQVRKFGNIKESTLRDWISRFNKSGIDGLIDKRTNSGRKPKTLSQDRKKLIEAVENPQSIGYEHVTCVKIFGYLKDKVKNAISYTTLWREVRRAGYVYKFPRKMAQPDYDEKKREKWLQERKEYAKKQQKWAQDESKKVWFLDEVGFEGDPRPRKRWIKKGEKKNMPYGGTHLRKNAIGSVCPKSGEVFSQIWPGVDSEVFQKYLDEMALEHQQITDIEQIISLDNASWHIAKKINWHHFTPNFQPAYSPDLNPIEQLWNKMKAEFFTDFIAKDGKDLFWRIVKAFQFYMINPKITKSICSTYKLFGNQL